MQVPRLAYAEINNYERGLDSRNLAQQSLYGESFPKLVKSRWCECLGGSHSPPFGGGIRIIGKH